MADWPTSSPSARHGQRILDVLANRERELTDEPIATDATTQPVPVTAGGAPIRRATARHERWP
ncbi:hypothetical protein [Natrinema sp. 1APR25-10V2]|uniref:hypothetical protein n=1 Tax=Natrinema sp. 1APR25-10V2 TaxID=2951081 RepID=UPI00287B93C8|nr:hypothetical protein [Natrinema sp. 1APR25-10V2]